MRHRQTDPDHRLTRTLLRILDQTEQLLQRRLPPDDTAELSGLEVSDSTWADWEAAQAEQSGQTRPALCH